MMCVRLLKKMVEWNGIDIHVKQVEDFSEGEKEDRSTNWPDKFQIVWSVISNLEMWWLEFLEMRCF